MLRNSFVCSKNVIQNYFVAQEGMNVVSKSRLLLNSPKACCLCQTFVKKFHLSVPRRKVEDRRMMLASLPAKDEGTAGEKAVDIDGLIMRKEDQFPDENTPNQLFDGIKFSELPIVNVKVSKNNTIITITDSKGFVKANRSCGMEGFRNTKKGTNIAAQATAISLCTKVFELGMKTVRVRVQGIGPGRMSAIKGLQMGGLNIVSVTDNTHVSWNPPRPRKQRRV